MRKLSRRLGVWVALLFVLGSVIALAPTVAKAHPSAPEHHGEMHHSVTAPCPNMPVQHQGDHACCLGAQNCTAACGVSLTGALLLGNMVANASTPSPFRPTTLLSRPLPPPLRPPRS